MLILTDVDFDSCLCNSVLDFSFPFNELVFRFVGLTVAVASVRKAPRFDVVTFTLITDLAVLFSASLWVSSTSLSLQAISLSFFLRSSFFEFEIFLFGDGERFLALVGLLECFVRPIICKSVL